MATSTLTRTTPKVGATVQLDGTAYTLADRAPGTAMWWGIAGDGTMAALSIRKHGTTADSSRMTAAESLQRAAAQVTRGTVYSHTFGNTVAYMIHSDSQCEHITGEPTTTGPTVYGTAYDMVYPGSNRKTAMVCRCVYAAPLDTPAPQPRPETAARPESRTLTALKAVAATEAAPEPEPTPEPAPAPKRPARATRAPKVAPAPMVRDVAEIHDEIHIFMEPGVTAAHAAMV